MDFSPSQLSEDSWDIVRPTLLRGGACPTPPTPFVGKYMIQLTETRIVKFILVAMGAKRSCAALRQIIAKSAVYRCVANDLLHPEGVRKRHGTLLDRGGSLPTFSPASASRRERTHPYVTVNGQRIEQ